MKKFLYLSLIFCSTFLSAQKVSFETLLNDDISVRAIQIWDGKVWYTGTDSKFGYVNLKDTLDKKQMRLSEKNLQFRTLAQDPKYFYTANIESPAYFFRINKKTLNYKIGFTDTIKSVFIDSFIMDKFGRGIAISDPRESGSANPHILQSVINPNYIGKTIIPDFPKYNKGEAHFAASNTNISMKGNWVWIATGGTKARIFRFSWNNPYVWQTFETPFIQGAPTQGIYSIDFFDKNFGIAVGGDYTKQSENINNIATTNDSGKTWQIQASGKNAGYMTCVKFRPRSKGKDILAVGDQHISFSSDYGKTWTKISDEKNLYACEWIDENTVVLAGKNRIVKMKLNE